MRTLVLRLAMVATLGLMAAACSQPARTDAMIANVTEATVVKPDSPLKESMTVAAVTGGEETSPLWISKVGNEGFLEALTLSLQQHTMLATSDGTLTLRVTLVELEQPFAGFDMEVTSTVRYVVEHQSHGTVFDETIKHAHLQDFSSAFVGSKRLQLANEGAIRNNIRLFIEKVITVSRQDPARFGGAVPTS